MCLHGSEMAPENGLDVSGKEQLYNYALYNTNRALQENSLNTKSCHLQATQSIGEVPTLPGTRKRKRKDGT